MLELYGKDNKNIKMTRGDSESIYVNGLNLVDGDIIYLTVKEHINTTSIAFQRKITEFVNGNAVIGIRPEDTKKLQFRKYVYDIQLTRADGTVTTIIEPHDFVIEGEVTYD
jgi:hypothetical protein